MSGKKAAEEEIAAVRRFNRFYTRELGILRRTFFDTPWTLGEVRVLYEIKHGASTARDIARALNVDAAYLSRLLSKLVKEGLVARKASAHDGRQYELSLTARGRAAYDRADERQAAQTQSVLARMPAGARKELVDAMARIETLMRTRGEEKR
ncbi:MAG: MarR family transcriptional regulator [Hyphomonadaceae bacterium]|nr:MarR family transcriptional regulator [Hyphomonadaceae bacterium]